MAQEAGQPTPKGCDIRRPERYYGERKVDIGHPRQDMRKLREMMRVKRPRKAGDK